MAISPLEIVTEWNGSALIRKVVSGSISVTTEMSGVESGDDPDSAWWARYLIGGTTSLLGSVEPKQTIRSVDLFSGPGGLALGLGQAARELGIDHEAIGAVDQDAGAIGVYHANHSPQKVWTDSAAMLVDYQIRGARERARFLYEPEMVGQEWSDLVGNIEIVLAGPPCQGHSNLNNQSRRTDSRNELYL